MPDGLECPKCQKQSLVFEGLEVPDTRFVQILGAITIAVIGLAAAAKSMTDTNKTGVVFGAICIVSAMVIVYFTVRPTEGMTRRRQVQVYKCSECGALWMKR
jgi:hypothetical protein